MDKMEKDRYIKELKKLRSELSGSNNEYKKYDEVLNRYRSVLPQILNYSNDREIKAERKSAAKQ